MFPLMIAAALALVPQQPSAASPQVALAAPQTVVTIDTGKMKGEPWRLAWSPDGAQLYFESASRDNRGNVKSTKGALVTIADRSVKNVNQPPAWAGKYWMWKSGQASPGNPAFKISVDQSQKTIRATAAPTGGALARGGTADPMSGSSIGDVASAANTAQVQTVFALKLRDEVLGEWVNEPVTPGVNYGWAPAPRHLIAFARREGGPLMTLDDRGRKQELEGAKEAVLPAFSEDGATLAWLEKKDKKHYDLTIAAIK